MSHEQSSKAKIGTSVSNAEDSKRNFLPVQGHHLGRRASAHSIYSGSDISELTFGSRELEPQGHDGIVRVVSNVSDTLLKPGSWRGRLDDFWIANYGAFLVLLSQFFGVLMNIATRILEIPGSHGEPMHPFEILLVRQAITSSICSAYMYFQHTPHFPLGPPGQVRWLLVSRGLFGFLGVFGIYFSLLYLPISEAMVLTFMVPILTCYACAMLIPGETFSRRQQIAGFVSLIGVIFIARPTSLFHLNDAPVPVPPANGSSRLLRRADMQVPVPTAAQHLLAVGVAMIGVVGGTGAITSIRAIGTRAHPLISVNYFSCWCTIVSATAILVIPSVKFRLPGNVTEWSLLLLLGFSGFGLQFLLTKGMAYGGRSDTSGKNTDTIDIEMRESQSTGHTQSGNVQDKRVKGSGTKATAMLYTQMIFSLIADKAIFNVTPDLWSWIGSGLIMFGALWVALDTSSSVADAKPTLSSGSAESRLEEANGLLSGSHENDDTEER